MVDFGQYDNIPQRVSYDIIILIYYTNSTCDVNWVNNERWGVIDFIVDLHNVAKGENPYEDEQKRQAKGKHQWSKVH